jgi:cullin 3
MAYREKESNYNNAEALAMWKPIEEAIGKVYAREKTNLSFMDFSNRVYNMVMKQHGEFGYTELKNYLTRQLKKDNIRLGSEKDTYTFLFNFHKYWKELVEFFGSLMNVFDFMNTRTVTKHHLSTIKGLGYNIAKEIFLEEKIFCETLQKHILKTIRKERDGDMVDRILLKNIISITHELGSHVVYEKNVKAIFSPPLPNGKMVKNNKQVDVKYRWMGSLDVYRKHFEAIYLDDTEKYYSEEAQKYASKLTPLDYLKIAEQRFQEELERANFYLDNSSKPFLIERVMLAYAIGKTEDIIDLVYSGLTTLFTQGNREDNRRIFAMFNQHKLTKDSYDTTFLAYEQKVLENILSKPKEEEKEQFPLIKNIILAKKKCQKTLDLFYDIEGEGCKIKANKIDEIYEKLITTNKKIVMELNSYLDFEFREGFRGLKDEEMEAILDDVMNVFKHIRDRDIFEKGYTFFLSKRLLQIKNLSHETEKVFLGKLRTECGSQFTGKMEVMFNDINLSKDIWSEFQTYYKVQSQKQQFGQNFPECFDVKVLTMGNWPSVNQNVYNLHEDVQGWANTFGDYYGSVHKGRRLIWVLSLGNAELRSTIGGKKKEFLVSSIQMMVLLMFNSKNSFALEEIQTRTQVPFEELEPHLLGLVAVKLLKKEGEDKDIKESDVLSINEKFTHKEYRVRVPASKKKKEADSAGDMQSILKKTENERKLRIEACIVRIMKARRKLKNTELFEEVMKMSNIYQFKPEIKIIKEAIEGLIEKEYLQRDATDRNVYHYIS